ncbi:MAG: zinc-dependent alcohol dehydrogenase family protein [Bacteroidota bacterium]
MKIALFEGPHHLNVTRKELRKLIGNEALIKVTSCGVCGTDLHIVEGSSRSSPPVVLGHEFAGIVADAGKEPNGCSVGDHVAVDPNIACGTCFYCRRGEVHLCKQLRALGVDIDGGMAEFCIVPSSQLYRLPGTMAPEQAAFIEPLSCVVHGIDRARIRAGDTVVILGGGTVGLLMLQLARISGASRVIIVEPVEWKRAIATRIGADEVLDPNAVDVFDCVRSLTGEGADMVIECAGRPETVALSLKLARRGGTVEWFGVCAVGESVQVESNSVYFKELTIVGSYVNPHTFDRSIALISSNKVVFKDFVIQKFPLDGVHDALRSLAEGKTIKSLIVPTL